MANHLINFEFDFGEMVYLKTDPEQNIGIVVSYRIYKGGEVLYVVNRGTIESIHYAFELTLEKQNYAFS